MLPISGPLPSPATVICVPREEAPRLFVVVDTEEEFDWTAPFSRERTQVGAMRHVGRAQAIFDRYDIRPTYVVDYCVAHQPAGYEPLLPILSDDHCTIGAHLHPWVNPPFDEAVTNRNSYGSNLDPALEFAKIRTLADEIGWNFGVRARVYKAGRYGIGAATMETLGRLEFEVDTSVNPTMDFSHSEGPSFADFGPSPFWHRIGKSPVLCLPCTVGFVGALDSDVARMLHRAASMPRLHRLRVPGVLARLGLVNKVMLSPEGNTLSEMKALARRLLAAGLRTFSLTFHSPSLEPGHTPYVTSEADLQRFLETIDRFCEFFVRDLNGQPDRPLEWRAARMEQPR